jgi:cytochrome P450
MFGELFRRLPDIKATAEPEKLRSNFIRGIKRLAVAFTPA